MTLEMKSMIEELWDRAESEKDPEKRRLLDEQANRAYKRGMIDCQYKTSSRVKWCVKAIWGLIAAVIILSCGGHDVVVNFFKAVL